MQAKNQSPKILAIGGTGRSGTSLLWRIFARHPEVAGVPEFRFTVDPDGLLDFYNAMSSGWSPYCFDAKLKHLAKLLNDLDRPAPVSALSRRVVNKFGWHDKLPFVPWTRYAGSRLSRHCPNYRHLVAEMLANLESFRFQGEWVGMSWLARTRLSYGPPATKNRLASVLGAFYRKVAVETMRNSGGRYVLEKNTWNILWFDRLLELVPEARLVHIVRDPRDVVASMTTQSWAPRDPSQAAQWVRDILASWLQIRASLPPSSFKEIRFEDLISDPSKTLREVCEFWALPWSEALLSENLSRHHIGRWKKQFDGATRTLVERTLRPVMEAFDYSPAPAATATATHPRDEGHKEQQP